MGCFTLLKNMKTKCDKTKSQLVSQSDNLATTRTLQYTPPGFKPSRMQSIRKTRAFSAPSALDAAEQDALDSTEFEQQEKSRRREKSTNEKHSPKRYPLPLPNTGALKNIGSFKSGMTSDPLYASGSSFDAAEQGTSVFVECEEQEGSKHRSRPMKEWRYSIPQPLPLPTPPGSGPLKGTGSFMSGTPIGSIRYFLYEEIAAACNYFSSDRCIAKRLSSTMYNASFGDDASSSKMFEATVSRLRLSTQGLREFINEVSTLSSLQHPNLCQLLGFHASDGFESEPRMLVYERLFHGSLDRLLFRRSKGSSIDWNKRMKIAICAAQGLTFLHEEGPFQAMYCEFLAANIQIDKDFNAKLSGYGCIGRIPEGECLRKSRAKANLSVETLKKGMLTPKSNVWSFGVVLLELLTGRKNYDSHLPKQERNLVKWCRPFLADDIRLSMIMDPKLKGCFPPKGARTVADIAQRCLQKEPSERPTMRAIVEKLKMIQDMYSFWFPLQESAATMSRKKLPRSSTDGNGIISHAPTTRLNFYPPLPFAATTPPRKWSVVPTVLPPPPFACSSNFFTGELNRQESTKSSSSVSMSTAEGY